MPSENGKSEILATLLICTLLALSQITGSHDSVMEHESNPVLSVSNGNQTIQGQSFLNFTHPISHSSQVNATWFARVSVLESYGTDLLENRSIGLLDQIDPVSYTHLTLPTNC